MPPRPIPAIHTHDRPCPPVPYLRSTRTTTFPSPCQAPRCRPSHMESRRSSAPMPTCPAGTRARGACKLGGPATAARAGNGVKGVRGCPVWDHSAIQCGSTVAIQCGSTVAIQCGSTVVTLCNAQLPSSLGAHLPPSVSVRGVCGLPTLGTVAIQRANGFKAISNTIRKPYRLAHCAARPKECERGGVGVSGVTRSRFARCGQDEPKKVQLARTRRTRAEVRVVELEQQNEDACDAFVGTGSDTHPHTHTPTHPHTHTPTQAHTSEPAIASASYAAASSPSPEQRAPSKARPVAMDVPEHGNDSCTGRFECRGRRQTANHPALHHQKACFHASVRTPIHARIPTTSMRAFHASIACKRPRTRSQITCWPSLLMRASFSACNAS
eukprot:357650-Chlamydomonas_euryale.AAC.2